MRTNSRMIHLIREASTRGPGVGLSYREFAHNFKDKVPAFVTNVSRVKQVHKLSIRLEPSVSVAVGFMADSVWFRSTRGVNNGACHRDALLLHDQTGRGIDMGPKTVVTRRGRGGSYGKCRV